MTTEKDKEKDPYAGLKALIYEQKPEARAAEIRAQKGKAKATAFLQAFTTLADAFTLGKGGDVVKRDMNPYILNNIQRAEAIGEQDRADKKAWENSLLNLENNIAQYNGRQIELAKQRQYAVEDREAQEKFARTMADDAHTKRKELMGEENEIWKGRESITSQRQRDRDEALARQEEKLIKLRGAIANSQQTAKNANDLLKAQLEIKSREVIEQIKNRGSNFMSIPNPNNMSEMIGIDESTMHLLFSLAIQDNEVNGSIMSKATYTNDDRKDAIMVISQKYPEKISQYLGALAPQILGTQGTTGATGTATQTPLSATGDGFIGPPPPDENRQKSTKNITHPRYL